MSAGCRRLLRPLALAGVAASALAAVAIASGAWSCDGAGSGAGGGETMPSGATPTAQLGDGHVFVSWAAATLPDGTPVAGYVVQRYGPTGAPAAVGDGCDGIVTTTSCSELDVPSGVWTYTDTPVIASWTGSESQPSAAVGVR